NQFPAVTAWTGTGLSTQLWTFARMSNFSRWYWNNPSRNTTLPGASLTAKIFSLGGDGAGQYAPRWYRQTYNPPDRAVCVPDRGDSALALAARGGIVPANVMVR
ncbi:MAG: hypothetical protein ACRD12_16795, partial [Acidimicrobiales bacterium]